MSKIRFESMFRPKSIAVIGASNRPGSLGGFVIKNLLKGDFHGPILPVNRNHESVHGVLCYNSVDELPVVPDLAILCTPPDTIPGLLRDMGGRGIRFGIVMTTNPGNNRFKSNREFSKAILNAARPFNVRILGFGSIGIILPDIGLNASWIQTEVSQGKLALVSQSGSLLAGILKWANANDIGFSHIISPGSSVDIDFGDILNYLAREGKARAILLNIRDIKNPRKFMSAARAVARIKPVIAIKSKRIDHGAGPIDSHDELVFFEDVAYDAAIRRAGMLRVYDTYELFDSVETLTFGRPLLGERLAIICNGKTPGQLAADRLVQGNGQLAQYSESTINKLYTLYPDWDGENPIDLGRNADFNRYHEVTSLLLKVEEVDALLVMHTPTPLSSGEHIARAIAKAAEKTSRNVLACWLGETRRSSRLQHFSNASIPVYVTPDEAVRAFLHLVNYRRNQEMLLETPSTPPPENITEKERIHSIISKYLGENIHCIKEEDTSEILSISGLNVPKTKNAVNADEAVKHAGDMGYPVSLRLSSSTLIQPFRMGSTSFDLHDGNAVRNAAEDIILRFRSRHPDRELPGFVVQEMVHWPDSIVLMAGIGTDPLFGPVIRLGRGGSLTSDFKGDASALPPLNMSLAGELISRTALGQIAKGNSDEIPFCEESLRSALVELSRLIIDHPEIISLIINPLLLNDKNILVVDARLTVKATAAGEDRLAIKPYPSELEETFSLKNGMNVLVRPIRPEDEPAYVKLLEKMSKKDLRQRFFGEIHKLPRSLLAQLIHIDYDREMAFAAAVEDEQGQTMLIGVVNISATQYDEEAEYAIIVRSDMQGQGLGRFLMEKIIRYCHSKGMERIMGMVLVENKDMLRLTKKLGFNETHLIEEDAMEVKLDLEEE